MKNNKNDPELDLLLEDIERLRNKLHSIIKDKDFDLQDPEIISASRQLNDAINKYIETLKRKKSPG